MMGDWLNKLSKGVQQSFIGRISTKSALDSLLWLIGLLVFLFLLAYTITREFTLVWILTSFLIVLVIFFIFIYFYFVKNDPDQLRSENFQLASKKLEIYGQKDEEISLDEVKGLSASSVVQPRRNIKSRRRDK